MSKLEMLRIEAREFAAAMELAEQFNPMVNVEASALGATMDLLERLEMVKTLYPRD